ncbi:hypothetical protein AAKU55_002006 [Oxalobacteraceae bacterium GrIS 1.11]
MSPSMLAPVQIETASMRKSESGHKAVVYGSLTVDCGADGATVRHPGASISMVFLFLGEMRNFLFDLPFHHVLSFHEMTDCKNKLKMKSFSISFNLDFNRLCTPYFPLRGIYFLSNHPGWLINL